MPTIIEHVSSRSETASFREGTAELVFHVLDTDDPLVVKTLLFAKIPPTYLDLCYQNANLQPLGAGIWHCTAKYARVENQYDVHLHFGGEKAKILVSLDTIESGVVNIDDIADSVEPTDYEGAINVNGDKIEGVDRYIRSGKMMVNWSAKYAFLDSLYTATVESLIGTCNGDAVIFSHNGQEHLFNVNELVLADADFKQTSSDGCAISLKFDIQRTESNLTIADLTHITKQGMHVLWVRSVRQRDTGAGVIRSIPQSYYIEKIYELADFGQFGIFDVIGSIPPPDIPEGEL